MKFKLQLSVSLLFNSMHKLPVNKPVANRLKVAVISCMKLLLDIEDSRAEPLLRLLVELDYVKAEIILPAKADLLAETKKTMSGLTMVKSGMLNARSAKDLLKEF